VTLFVEIRFGLHSIWISYDLYKSDLIKVPLNVDLKDMI
jgi:hypothetical protein